MILFINVKIAQHRFYDYRQSSHYPNNDRMDVFKYCLSSYAAMLPLITKCVFYIEVSSEYSDRKDELNEYIHTLFSSKKLSIHWHRNNFTKDWRESYKELENEEDDIIWFAANDDHIFIDSTLNVVSNGLNILKEDNDSMSFIYFSHWPEMIKMAKYHNGELLSDGNFVKFNWSVYDAIVIMKKDRFKRYWFEYDYGDKLLYKPDEFFVIREPINTNVYCPTKEIVRHFDGYGHMGNLNNIVPPLFIPTGFFENNIKIKYGYIERYDGYININPSAEYTYAAHPNGVDYRWSIYDIPLFWKDKITEIDINPKCDLNLLKEYRNHYYIESSRLHIDPYYVKHDHGNPPPIEWFKNHL